LLAQLAAIVAPIFICAAIGYLWARLRRPFEAEFVTQIVTMVGTPFLVFSSLTALPLEMAIVGEMAGAALLAFISFAIVGIAVLRLMRLPLHSYLPALIFPNGGNMGLPLCLFAFGEKGLALAIVFFAVFSMLQFTLGVSIAAGSVEPGRLLRLPLIYAVAAALVFVATGIPVPGWLANSADLIGGLTIPLMLIALGVSLARLQIGSLRRSLVLSLVRLLAGAAIGFGIGWALGLSEVARGVLAIQSAMPVAVFNYLFAQLYRREPAEVAGMIVLSTLLSFVLLPLLLLLLLQR
jgi:predicted permease